MRNKCGTGLAGLVGLSMLAVAVHADEEKISVEKLPSAVTKAVKKKFPKARIVGAAKEVEDGHTTYEVELKVESRSVDLALNADGKVLEIEKEVPVDELPKAVRKRLAARYPGATIEKVEEVTKGEDGPVRYEVAIKAEVVFTAKGKIVQAKEDDEDDEKPAAKAGKQSKDDDDEDDDDDDDDEDDDDDDDREVKAKKGDKD
jgi:Putative beta-lactamase-inhibitor-like, PepSY-like